MIHPSLRALVAIVFGVGVAVGARTAEAATHKATHTPTSVAQTNAATPAPDASATPAPVATAQPMATPAPMETPAQKLKFHGSGDIGFTRIQGPGILTGRVFQPASAQNTPNLQNIYIGATLNTSHFGGELDVSLGPDADVIAPYETNSRPGGFPGSRQKGWDVTQAYITHKCDKGGWVSLGKFEELSGVEKIESAKDWNYSRGILFAANPFSETGVRAGWADSTGRVSLTLGETLGWNDIKEPSIGNAAHNLRTSEASLKIKSSPNTELKLTANIGKAQDDDLIAGLIAPSPTTGLPLVGMRRSYDGVISGKVTNKLTLVGNYNYGTQDNVFLANPTGTAFTGIGTARWQGGAAYANYQISNKLSGTIRAELFRDTGGFTTFADQKLAEQTATLQYAWSNPLLFRVEYRNDDSNQPVFGRLGSAPVKMQHTLGAEAIVRY